MNTGNMKTLYGTKAQLLPIAHELMKLGLPTGLREIERDTWAIEIPVQELALLEKIHITAFNGKRKQA